jgi:hypothetical protein
LLFAGCSAGKKLSYTDTPAHVDASGTGRVAVTVYDQRKVITSGQESPAYVGRERSLYHSGPVITASGRPLADDLTNLLVMSLAAKGFKASPIVVLQSERPEAIAEKLAVLQVDRCVALTIVGWGTDTRTDNNARTELVYDLDLRVLDSRGNVLALRRLAGHEDPMGGPARDAFRRKLESLINAPEVTQALNVNEAPATAAPTSGGPNPPAASGEPPTSSRAADVETQLQKLKELYEKGLITEDVYKEKMRQILNKL